MKESIYFCFFYPLHKSDMAEVGVQLSASTLTLKGTFSCRAGRYRSFHITISMFFISDDNKYHDINPITIFVKFEHSALKET